MDFIDSLRALQSLLSPSLPIRCAVRVHCIIRAPALVSVTEACKDLSVTHQVGQNLLMLDSDNYASILGYYTL